MTRVPVWLLALGGATVAAIVVAAISAPGTDPAATLAPAASAAHPSTGPATVAAGADSSRVPIASMIRSESRQPTSQAVANTVSGMTEPAPTTTSAATSPRDAGETQSDTAAVPVTMPARGLPAVLTTPPTPPRLTPLPADYVSPEAAAAAWMAAWCYQPLTMPANQNITKAKGWVTALGYAADKAGALSGEEWRAQVDSGLTPICGPVSAIVSPDAPAVGNARWVLITTRRAYVIAGGTIKGQQQVSRTRRLLQAPDGRWLVDAEVTAG